MFSTDRRHLISFTCNARHSYSSRNFTLQTSSLSLPLSSHFYFLLDFNVTFIISKGYPSLLPLPASQYLLLLLLLLLFVLLLLILLLFVLLLPSPHALPSPQQIFAINLFRLTVLTVLPLKMERIGCPETSATNYQRTLRNMPEQR